MTKFILSGLIAVAALAITDTARAAGPWGCPTCVGCFGKMHQHGPLYNYGPYYGYYPFAPYGPWNSDLTLNGNCGNGNCGRGGINWPHLNLGHKNNCNSSGGGNWGHYAHHTLKNVFHRTHPCHSKAGCDSCSSSAGLSFSPIQTVSATAPAK